MKKTLVLPLEDEDVLELCRISIDRDERAALEFIDLHLRKQVNKLLEGG
mgnify:CR=1 FL=1